MTLDRTPAVTSANNGGISDRGSDSGDVLAFQRAAASPGNTPPAGGSPAGVALTVSGNTIDTGRYQIIGLTSYNIANGNAGGDGELEILDKQTGSYVDVYGDPHVYTSAGTNAAFQANGLVLVLGDGAEVNITPTALSGGVSHIGSVTVTKDGCAATMSGFYQSGGTGNIVTRIADPTTPGATATSDETLLLAGKDGSLGTLSFADGSTLTSNGSAQTRLDGKGGGDKAALDAVAVELTPLLTEMNTPEAAQLLTQLQALEQGGSPTGSVDAVSPPGAGISGAEIQAMLAAANGAGPSFDIAAWSDGNANSTMVSLINDLLQQLQPGDSAPANPAAGLTRDQIDTMLATASGTPVPMPASPSEALAMPAGDAAKTVSLLQRLLAIVDPGNAGANAPGSSGSPGPGQLDAVTSSNTPNSAAFGIGPAEIQAMIAGTNVGKPVDIAAWENAPLHAA